MDTSQELLSNIIVYTKYAKYLPRKKRRETWAEIVDRNKTMHKKKFKDLGGEFLKEIDDAYQFVFDKKVLPSMRSMQFAGKPIEISPIRIYNCCYLPVDDYRAFSETMFLLLCGSGVGFSVQNHHVEKLPEIRKPTKNRRFLIGDSIEGWADAVKALIRAYLMDRPYPRFDFSDIREKDALLKTSGGRAPGPEPLKDCLHNIQKVLDRKDNGSKLTPLECHDILCHISDCVLAGGIRRSSSISLFSFDDEDMITCKYGNWWELNPQRARANNSVVALRSRIKKKDFQRLWDRIKASKSGEPGIFFTNDPEWGSNPCGEISLRSCGVCNLTEVNVSDVVDQADLNKRVEIAAFIGTIQASYTDFHYLRDEWKKTAEKEALIGVGMTGIASGKVLKLDLEEAAEIVNEKNAEVAKKIGINRAARTTTVKPSGTAALVLGCSSGIHAWHSSYYIRRMQVLKNESIYKFLKRRIPSFIEDDHLKPATQAVISIPQKSPKNSITRDDEDAITLLERVKKFNEKWIRTGLRSGHNPNNVSTTVTVKDDEWDSVASWMWDNRKSYNALSILPYADHTYVQAPFESIAKKEFDELNSKIKEVDFSKIVEEEDMTNREGEVACSTGYCEII